MSSGKSHHGSKKHHRAIQPVYKMGAKPELIHEYIGDYSQGARIPLPKGVKPPKVEKIIGAKPEGDKHELFGYLAIKVTSAGGCAVRVGAYPTNSHGSGIDGFLEFEKIGHPDSYWPYDPNDLAPHYVVRTLTQLMLHSILTPANLGKQAHQAVR